MSKNINVNPDHYKNAGRERQGDDVVQSSERQIYEQQQAVNERWQARERARAQPTPAEALAAHRRPRRRKTRS